MVSLVAKIVTISALLLLKQFWLCKEWEEVLHWNELLLHALSLRSLSNSAVSTITSPQPFVTQMTLSFWWLCPKSCHPNGHSHSMGRRWNGCIPRLSCFLSDHRRLLQDEKASDDFSGVETKKRQAPPPTPWWGPKQAWTFYILFKWKINHPSGQFWGLTVCHAYPLKGSRIENQGF